MNKSINPISFKGGDPKQQIDFGCIASIYLRCLGIIARQYVAKNKCGRRGLLWLAVSVKQLGYLLGCGCSLADELIGTSESDHISPDRVFAPCWMLSRLLLAVSDHPAIEGIIETNANCQSFQRTVVIYNRPVIIAGDQKPFDQFLHCGDKSIVLELRLLEALTASRTQIIAGAQPRVRRLDRLAEAIVARQGTADPVPNSLLARRILLCVAAWTLAPKTAMEAINKALLVDSRTASQWN